MNDNLAAINALSDQWEDAFESEGFIGFQGDRFPNQKYHEKGERILGMYEAEYAKAPRDADIALALADHLFRLANARYAQLRLGILEHQSGSATAACEYALRCCTMFPNCGAAGILAIIYRSAGFYGTAMYWSEKMKEAAELKGLQDRAIEARAMMMELQAEGKTTDPYIQSGAVFPTRDTPGLVLANQPANPPPAAGKRSPSSGQPKSGGCYIATACYGSHDHPDVVVLRRFRDERMMPSVLGRCIVRFYYRVSPALAERLGRSEWLSGAIRRRLLEPLASRLDI